MGSFCKMMFYTHSFCMSNYATQHIRSISNFDEGPWSPVFCSKSSSRSRECLCISQIQRSRAFPLLGSQSPYEKKFTGWCVNLLKKCEVYFMSITAKTNIFIAFSTKTYYDNASLRNVSVQRMQKFSWRFWWPRCFALESDLQKCRTKRNCLENAEFSSISRSHKQRSLEANLSLKCPSYTPLR